MGSCLVNHWSKTQGTVSLSSGEAELSALVKCSGPAEAARRWHVADIGSDISQAKGRLRESYSAGGGAGL